MKTGEFVAEWPNNLSYPTNYQIVSSMASNDQQERVLTSIIGTDEDFDSVVANLGAAFESDSEFQAHGEPTEIKLGELHSMSFYFKSNERSEERRVGKEDE